VDPDIYMGRAAPYLISCDAVISRVSEYRPAVSLRGRDRVFLPPYRAAVRSTPLRVFGKCRRRGSDSVRPDAWYVLFHLGHESSRGSDVAVLARVGFFPVVHTRSAALGGAPQLRATQSGGHPSSHRVVVLGDDMFRCG